MFVCSGRRRQPVEQALDGFPPELGSRLALAGHTNPANGSVVCWQMVAKNGGRR